MGQRGGILPPLAPETRTARRSSDCLDAVAVRSLLSPPPGARLSPHVAGWRSRPRPRRTHGGTSPPHHHRPGRARGPAGVRGAHPRQHRAGDRGQARGRPALPRRPARRGSPADRGRPGSRQDDAGQVAGPLHRLLRAAHPVHARPAAERRDRRVHLRPGGARVRVQARRRVRQPRRRRRDQPGLPQDPVGAAGGDGGAAGVGGRHHVRAGDPVHGHRHAEPDRDGRHLPAARGAARPLHRAGVHGLPLRRGRDGAAELARLQRPPRRPRAGRRRPRGPQAHRGRARDPRLDGGQAVRRRPAHRDPHRPRPAPGRLPSRRAPAGPRRPRIGGARRPRLRAPRRHPAAGRTRAGPPTAADG